MIEVNNVSRRYGSFTAVDGVSLRLRNGHTYGLIGPTGCGKSSLLRLIAGSLPPTSGTIVVDGYDLSAKPREAGRQIGYCPADFAVCGDMTVRELFEFVASARGVKGELAVRQINEVTVAAGLVPVRDKLLSSLSGMDRRRAGLAQALIGNPGTILLDEPLAGLSGDEAADTAALIRRLFDKKTVLLTAASREEAASVCGELLLMEAGRLTGTETVPKAPVGEDIAPAPGAAESDPAAVPASDGKEDLS